MPVLLVSPPRAPLGLGRGRVLLRPSVTTRATCGRLRQQAPVSAVWENAPFPVAWCHPVPPVWGQRRTLPHLDRIRTGRGQGWRSCVDGCSLGRLPGTRAWPRAPPRVLTFPVSVARVTRQKSQLGLTGVLCGSLSSGRGHAGPLDVAEAGPSDFVSNGFLCVTAGVQATEEENGYAGFRQH